MRIAPVLVALLALAACDRSHDSKEEKASIKFDGSGNDHQVSITADSSTGKAAIKIPGIEAKFNVPKEVVTGSNFDIDGVKHYPGSEVQGVNIQASDEDGADRADVEIKFLSPAAPAEVAAYFRKSFAENGITISGSDARLGGKTKDGDSFTVAIADAGNGKSSGSVVIADAK